MPAGSLSHEWVGLPQDGEPSQTAPLRLEKAVVAAPDEWEHGAMSQVDDSSYTPVTLDGCWRLSGPFFHGTRVALQVGDELVPRRVSNFHQGRVMNNIYFTTLMETAVWGAELATARAGAIHRGYVYEVEPTGPFEDDPNVTNKKVPGQRHTVLPVPAPAARHPAGARLAGPRPRDAREHAHVYQAPARAGS